MQENDLRHVYVLVRSDIPPRHQAVQATHAGIEAGRCLIPPGEQHPNLVVLTVPSEPDITRWSERLLDLGISNTVFIEDDMGGQYTALATEPLDADQRSVFKDLPLLDFPQRRTIREVSPNGETFGEEKR